MRPRRSDGEGRLAAQITMSACEENCRRSVPIAAGTHVAGRSHDEQRGFFRVPAVPFAYLPDGFHDEANSQRIAGGEDRIVFFRKLVEVALDQNRTESAETHDPGPRFDRAGRRS